MSTIRELYYLRSIDRRWKNELRKACQKVVVLSPYITSTLAESVLECASAKICEIYTTFLVETFAAGASSINTLKKLQNRGYSIYDLEGLHAKIIIVDESFASIGSQNLTRRGGLNLEASVAICDPEYVAAIAEGVRMWIVNRRPITQQMLADMEEKVQQVVKDFKATRSKVTQLEEDLREATQRRARASWAERAQKSIRPFVPDGNVSIETAVLFIQRSLWWFHPSGSVVREPKYAWRIKGHNNDWRLTFGGNTFLVGRAIQRCARTIESFLSDVVHGKETTKDDLIYRLRRCVCGSVAKYNGDEYNGDYPLTGIHMKFGVHAIDVNEFIHVFLNLIEWETIPA